MGFLWSTTFYAEVGVFSILKLAFWAFHFDSGWENGRRLLVGTS
jgi:hypothetical protein